MTSKEKIEYEALCERAIAAGMTISEFCKVIDNRNKMHFDGNMKLFGRRVVSPNKGKGRKNRPRNSNRLNRIRGN